MIDFCDIGKHFGTQVIFRKANFKINKGERVGLVGPNGAGKSTIFALLLGETIPDSSNLRLAGTVRIGHLRQEFNPHEVTSTLIEYAESGRQDLIDIHDELESLEKRLHSSDAAEKKSLLGHIGRLQTLYEAGGGYAMRAKAASALSGLGLTEDKFARSFSSFSGGWQMRAELARVLVSDPDLLLLDEPTNYLDIPAIEWLRGYLKDFTGTMLLISHDRYLLNTLTSKTLEVANMGTEKYNGNYDHYVKERELRYEQRLAASKNQQKERERVKLFIDRFRAKSSKAAQVQSRIKMLDRMEEEVVPQKIVAIGGIRLRRPPRCGQEVARLENLGFSYDGSNCILKDLCLSIQREDKVAFVGLNGTGKSTILRILAGKLEPSEGRRVLGHNVVPGYQSQEFAETMDPELTVFETIKRSGGDATAQEARNLLGSFGFSGDAVEKKVAVLSGGEKVRLAFARLLIDPPNFLILDEPTTHLDIAAREALEKALREFEGTICMVSHDIQFVRLVATSIAAMHPPGIRHYCGNYDYYCEKMAIENSDAGAQQGAGKEYRESDRKIQRRERAAAVQERGRQKRKLASVLAETEKLIDRLENEERQLVSVLEGPPTAIDYSKMNRRLAEIHEQMPEIMEKWEKTAAELHSMERE